MFTLDFTSINKYVIVCLVTKKYKTSKRQKGKKHGNKRSN